METKEGKELRKLIQRRERQEDTLMEYGTTDPVYVVVIASKRGDYETIVGAVFRNEAAARQEAKNLNAANNFNRAYYVERQLG